MRATSIRTHIMFLVLAISIPLVVIVGLAIYFDMQQNIAHTKTSLRILAQIMVRNTGNKISETREVLERIAVRPQVIRRDPRHCDPILENLKSLKPGYANLGYSNLDGLVVCTAVPRPGGKPVNLGKTPWFQKVLQTKSFNVGQPFLGPLTGKWVSVLSVPIWNTQHEMVGLTSIPLDLNYFDPNIPSHMLPDGSQYGFYSDDGILVWRNVDPHRVIGTRPRDELTLKILKEPDSEVENLDADGISRFVSAVHMRDSGMIAWISVPTTAINTEAKQRALSASITVATLIFMLYMIAIAIARRITGPVAELEITARALKSGNLNVRASEKGPSDIAAVAEEFNAMIHAQQLGMEQLRISATAFETQDSLMITDANSVILRVNTAFIESTGYTSEDVVGQTPRIFKSGRHDRAFYRAMWESIQTTGTWRGEIWDRRKNGEVYPKLLTITAVKDTDGRITHYVGSHIDITARKAAEEEINNLAFYDSLTQLPNRRLLMDRLQHALATSERCNCIGALLFIDLDNFKSLNDTMGHEIGDQLLQHVAKRLTTCVRVEDTVARLGGDEFILILENLHGDMLDAAAKAKDICEKIKSTFSQTCKLGTYEHKCSASIGVTLFNGYQTSKEELMKQADIAMYQAKKSGRNTVCFYDQKMQENITARVMLETELHKAIINQQFHLHFQIQVDANLRPLGAETLVRWQHPARGIVNPAEFIPLAEESGLILPLGHWVLSTACQQLAIWARQPETAHLVIAVNISAKQFHLSSFVEEVLSLVDHFGIDPAKLKLEITESMLLDKVGDIITKMNVLKARGINFSLDDFGTGYSSLQYLKLLPLDQLKVDQSFVRDIATDTNDQAIVRTIIAMAKSLNLDIIAEGVETEEQRQFLLRNGCTSFQGYLFGNPVPIEQLDIVLKRG